MRVWYDAETVKPPRSEDDPTESVVVLVVDKYGAMYTATYYHELGWWEEAYCYGSVDVTLWRYLPTLPVQCKDCKKAQMGYEKPHLIW